MNILKILENENISDLSKLELLKKYEYDNDNDRKSNIFIDLMDDWENGLI
jgi:hypothetical protein